ncbi:hypothetical protein Sango_2868300 [Sesamum angolense]|uniref:DDE Tnp4 domain-containing protein n=1 Tax=Sesamum angolense TaxID=2727404 RepID=A0AAE1T6E5_9LAMI|nr:hypothetical protein Sango_2868300 [Sesamum angolense]
MPTLDCLGALDGTIDIRVQKRRYRTRKGQAVVNIHGVCNPNMQFIYVLSGWECSVANNHVLQDTIHKPSGLRVPTGNYYLCDNDYADAKAEWNLETGFHSLNNEPPQLYNINLTPQSTRLVRPNIQTSSRKRKVSNACPEILQLVNMISNLCDTTNTRLGSLTRVLESEFDDPDKRRMVMDIVKEISGVDKNDFLLVTRNWYMNPRTWKSFSVSQGNRRRKCNLDGRDNRGKKFAGKGCLGVLDGMYLDVRVHVEDRARYRMCNYYLVDSGYNNGEGFLSPYQGYSYKMMETKELFDEELNGMENYHPCIRKCLREVCANGLECDDNGFRTGYTGIILQIDPFAKTLRYKSFSYYAQWCEVFGKDRAMSDRGLDPIVAPRNPGESTPNERSENLPVMLNIMC